MSRITIGLGVAACIALGAADARASAYDDALNTYKAGDYAKATKMLQPLVAAGVPNAESLLAEVYWFGQGIPADPVIAVRLLREAAIAGDSTGQTLLGNAYFLGRGVERDQRRGIALWRLAAAKHDPDAEMQLGEAHLQGDGVPKDAVTGVNYIREAAYAGLYIAQWSYAGMLARGLNGVPIDTKESLRLMTLAADQRYLPAELALALGYTGAQGMPRNPIMAAAWADVADDAGCDVAKKLVLPLLALKFTSTIFVKGREMADQWEQRHPPHPSIAKEPNSRMVCAYLLPTHV